MAAEFDEAVGAVAETRERERERERERRDGDRYLRVLGSARGPQLRRGRQGITPHFIAFTFFLEQGFRSAVWELGLIYVLVRLGLWVA
jgi:hypothetical protein